MTAIALSLEAATWAAEVRAHLADLPATDRDELLEDLDALIVDVEAEGESVVDRLGSPRDYAAELRSAAGLPAAGRVDAPLLLKLRQVIAQPWVRSSRTFLGELKPGWWVARGLVLGLLFVLLLSSDTQARHLPLLRLWHWDSYGWDWYDGDYSAVVVYGGSVMASVLFGRRVELRHPIAKGLLVSRD
jgi:hypothetical protein